MRFTLSLFVLAASFVSPVWAQDLKGDADAAALVRKMLDRLGGAEIWSESPTLYLEYSGWRSTPAEAVDERGWRSFATPDQRIVFEGSRSDTIFHMTADASWLEFSGRGPHRFNEQQHAENINFWNFDFYTVLYNLARGDERITLRLEAPQTVRLTGPKGADWGWFEIDATGQPVRWGARSGDDDLEYVYGPVKAFGNINFPAWGAATNGTWRFEYNKVDLSREPYTLEASPPQL